MAQLSCSVETFLFMQSLGQYIEHLRIKKGWSQRELAKRSELSSTHIRRLEADENESTVTVLKKLGVNPETLFNIFMGKDPETAKSSLADDIAWDLINENKKETIIKVVKAMLED